MERIFEYQRGSSAAHSFSAAEGKSAACVIAPAPTPCLLHRHPDQAGTRLLPQGGRAAGGWRCHAAWRCHASRPLPLAPAGIEVGSAASTPASTPLPSTGNRRA